MAFIFKKLITPAGIEKIYKNGIFNISDKENVYVEVNGKPYRLTKENMDILLQSGKLEEGDIVLATDTKTYYAVASNNGVYYFQELSIPNGTLKITSNGVYEVAEFEYVDINVNSDLVIYDGSYEVTPSVDSQTLFTKDKTMSDNVTVKSIPYYETSNEQNGKTIYIG